MILAKNLSKTYGSLQALNNISLNIKEGECYGLLGPNGAGKTTSIAIMSSLIAADKGSVHIDGNDIQSQAVACKKNIGVVSQEIALYEELSGYDNLYFWGSLYQIPKKVLINRIAQILDLLGLSERQDDKIKNYSGGMKRRINIASALLHRPKVLFMDEPTVGIDPQSRNLIFEVIEQLRDDGMTIVYTTHYMEEAERLCDRIGIIDNGTIIAEGTIDMLKASSAIEEGIAVTFSSLTDTQYNKLTVWKNTRRHDNTVYFYTAKIQKDLPQIVVMCTDLNVDITAIDIQKSNLETIFLHLTGKQLRDL